jgi:hypothetical protein
LYDDLGPSVAFQAAVIGVVTGHAVHEARHRRHRGRGGVAVDVPAERVVDRLPRRRCREQLDVGERDVGARHGVAAPEVDRRAARVVGPPDPRVGDAGDEDGGGGVLAAPGEAVVLVDDDGVAHGVHAHVLERHRRHGPRPALPRLDPDPVVRVPDHGVAHRHVGHARPGALLAQGPDADAVAQPAGDVLDVHVEGAGADGDAVVAVGDRRVGDEHVLGVLDVDAVRVGALLRGADGQAAHQHAAAAVETEVELGAVLHLEALHRHVVAREEPERLQAGHHCRRLEINVSSATLATS